MPGNLTLETLRGAVAAGEIDTVLCCACDMQGRLVGKRFHAQHFLESGHKETHGCNYLLAVDMEMTTVPGYKAASWAGGYGDYIHKPDLGTLRRAPWLSGTAMVMADFLDHHGEPVAHAPRNVLKRQVERARALGLEPMMATELEFFLFEESFEQLWDRGHARPTPVVRYNNDYGILGSSKEEAVMRPLRNALFGAGIAVENTKGEAEAGQEEVNIRYSDALDTADSHSIVKMVTKEVAQAAGRSVTFMAKYDTARAGSSSHIHQSLWRDGRNVFLDEGAAHGMSGLMRSYLAGLLAHAGECTYFLAPYVNSYKRFTVGMFAPTKAVWSRDNRTAGYRVCGEGTKGVRVECRVGGADLNPYLALAAQLAAGLAGVEAGLELEPEMAGDVYSAEAARAIPRNLREAAEALRGSAMLRAAMGDDVVEHYTRAATWEIEECDRMVTDWDLRRGFERA
ncbi:glutamine synthetase family protein [Rubellimicrobium aerolatum]|uniref:Glutamine synthetase family protein n=1 Tax=Rubellimicrobium aerolatum TaxID=490979 RepID=A0ABW0S8S7_9RHOB|nr:glutamine synthetase family protein [Rubellimicrobium aerolatum]MBP1804693.1 glutamine synthetase [Rubellimicrobium aerolatum]